MNKRGVETHLLPNPQVHVLKKLGHMAATSQQNKHDLKTIYGLCEIRFPQTLGVLGLELNQPPNFMIHEMSRWDVSLLVSESFLPRFPGADPSVDPNSVQ